jgi:phage terminase large subunit-like protein
LGRDTEAALAWDLSCPDWEQRLKDGRSLVPDLPLNHAAAEAAVRGFDALKLADVPGTPYLADLDCDWFREIVRALFGSVVDGKRMVREPFLLVPKKNSKTTYGALLMVVALMANLRPRATFIMTAPVQDVAEIAFSAAAGAIALDPELQKILHVRDHLKTIEHRVTKAKLEIMTFDPSVLTGQKCAGVLIDELHVVAKMSKAASAIRQLRGGMLPFPEAFMSFITTQSEDAPAGVFRAELQKARAIRDGKQRGVMLPVLYELPQAVQADPNQWRDSANWRMVTPNSNVEIQRLADDFATAEATGEEELRAWASQHLNVEIGLALHSDRWTGADFWAQNVESGLTLDALLKRCDVVTAGIDGGGLDDLLGLAILGRETGTGRWLLWTHAWCHPIALQRRKSHAERFRDFERDGDLTIVDTVGEDVTQAAAYVLQCEEAGLLDRIGVDANGIGPVIDALDAVGIKSDRIVGITQGWRLNGAIKHTERQLAAVAMIHAGQALMRFAVENAKVEPRGNAIVITKQAAGWAKIDPLMATFDAASLMALNPEPRRKNYQLHFV